MTTPLDLVKKLNYDHHRRMTALHERFVAEGTGSARAGVDDASYSTLLASVPQDRRSILELGSASGAQWPLLQTWLAPGGLLSGIDLYEPLVRKAQHDGLNITLGFVEELPYVDAAFDLVCSRHVMEHLGDLDKGIAHILRVLKPGGYVAHVTPDMPGDNEPAHLNHFDVDAWEQIWREAGLHVVRAMKHPYNGGEVHVVGQKA